MGHKKPLSLFILIILSLVCGIAESHRGGQDKHGCHNDRKVGNYHCHKGPFAGRTFDSKEQALEALGVVKESPETPTDNKFLFHAPGAKEKTKVTRVVDGDTLVIADGRKVRLIGVDTPELHHPKKPVQYFAKEAKNFVQDLVQDQAVTLEFEIGNAYLKHKDKYGRLLAYVILPNGEMLNAKIIREGYGFAYTRFPFKFMEEFRALEREARESRRGLWK
ncbi:MAG: thermonuclease family protein [Elusimicrobiota bacterium]